VSQSDCDPAPPLLLVAPLDPLDEAPPLLLLLVSSPAAALVIGAEVTATKAPPRARTVLANAAPTALRFPASISADPRFPGLARPAPHSDGIHLLPRVTLGLPPATRNQAFPYAAEKRGDESGRPRRRRRYCLC
jgi:hypothetical protein